MWTCSACTYQNDISSTACEICGAAKPAAARAPAKLTAAQRAAVGLPLPDAMVRPPYAARAAPSRSPLPSPPSASDLPFASSSSASSAARYPFSSSSSASTAPVGWNCDACTYQNESSSRECEMCGARKPLDTPDAIIERHVTRECGPFTDQIPGARTRLS